MKTTISPKKIKESKAAAFEQIKKFLDADDVNAQFDSRSGDYHSSDKFIVTWNGNYKKMWSEFGIDKCDSFYASYSGYRAIYVARGLFHEKQLGGYATIERALLEVGMKLCPKNELEDFFKKYVVPYNERLKAQKSKSK